MKLVSKSDIVALLLNFGFHQTWGQFIMNVDKNKRVVFKRSRRKNKTTNLYSYNFYFASNRVYNGFYNLKQDQSIDKLHIALQTYFYEAR